MFLKINVLLLVKLMKNMKKSSFLIAGRHAVIEALKNPDRIVERVFLTEESKKNINRENQKNNLLLIDFVLNKISIQLIKS